MNPDGYTDQSYENVNMVNLNRDFPDPVQRKGKTLVASGREQVCLLGWWLSKVPLWHAAGMLPVSPAVLPWADRSRRLAPAPVQPETAAVMNLFLSRHFTAAANMHEVRRAWQAT